MNNFKVSIISGVLIFMASLSANAVDPMSRFYSGRCAGAQVNSNNILVMEVCLESFKESDGKLSEPKYISFETDQGFYSFFHIDSTKKNADESIEFLATGAVVERNIRAFAVRVSLLQSVDSSGQLHWTLTVSDPKKLLLFKIEKFFFR